MRSKLITVATGLASTLLVAQVAAADSVQEQLRLMEERMAAMEDRLQATSTELETARATVDEQQAMLSDAGLIEATEEKGLRSGVGAFFDAVDITGVVAASYNYRFLDSGDDQSAGANVGLFRHPDANTFALDQMWMVIDKPVTDESRGGMHVEVYAGKTAQIQNADGNSNGIPVPAGVPTIGGTTVNTNGSQFGLELYTAYASYLAPIGNGVQIDAGLLATPLGAEVLQTNQNMNITTGLVFGLQPVTHTGVQFSTGISDEVTLVAGVVNDVYNETNLDLSNGKAGYWQVQYGGDSFGLNVGAIVGTNSGLSCTGAGFDADSSCNTSVFDVLLTADPTDELSLWVNFDWARNFGKHQVDGDAYGLAMAGRLAITDDTGFATRFEYVRTDNSFFKANTRSTSPGGSNALSSLGGGTTGEIISLTGTIDHQLVEGVKVRAEARWDRRIDDNGPPLFANGENGADNSGAALSRQRDDQVVGLAELFFEF